nr:hypothetical protein OG409_16090 [Streptomyces sp. NBC_00974]
MGVAKVSAFQIGVAKVGADLRGSDAAAQLTVGARSTASAVAA